MDRALTRFAGWVVARQASLLILVATVVLAMAWWIYSRARDSSIAHASKQQMLLAEQTAKGIENYYVSILDTLDLLRRNTVDEDDPLAPDLHPDSRGGPILERMKNRLESGATAPLIGRPVARQVLMPIFWEQLRERISQLFLLDNQSMRVVLRFADDDAPPAEAIIEARRNWLANLTEPGVSKASELAGPIGNLVCVPMPGGRRSICAVVPMSKIDAHFLTSIRKDDLVGAMLMDEAARVMSFNDPRLIGASMLTETKDPFMLQIMTQTLNGDQPRTSIYPRPLTIAGKEYEAGIVSIQPIKVGGGKWWLAISSSLDEVEQVVQVMFRRIALFAAVAIGVFTFAFSRLAISQIRARAREERVMNDMLRKEVEQARKIQLAWLPHESSTVRGIDICAVNKAANHISGDFYNWFELPDGRACVLIGDVTGHGISGAFLMATTQMLLRAVMIRLQDPGRAIQVVNAELAQQESNGQFVTLMVMAIDRETGTVQIATAGHPPPVILRDGRVELLKIEPQLVAGVDRAWVFPTETFEFPGATSVLLYTDGVPDAPAEGGNRFDDEGMLASLAHGCESARVMIDQVLTEIDRFRGIRELSDDVTMVAIQFSVPASATLSTVMATTE